jgi:predicted lipoprotein with Yx(FWY)xxD motif
LEVAMKRSITALAAAAAAVALAALVAGCGGSSGTSASGGSNGYGYGNSSATVARSGAGVARIAAASSSLGRILVNGQGRTVYLFQKDTGKASTCYGACAGVWRPVTATGAPQGGTGAVAAKLGTSKRSNGVRQVTYNGHPLYTYAGDAKPGQTKGQAVDEFGAEWYVLSPAGKKIENGES